MQITPKSMYKVTWGGVQLHVGQADQLWLNLLTFDFDNERQVEIARAIQQDYDGYLAHLRLEELVQECEKLESAINTFTGEVGLRAFAKPPDPPNEEAIRTTIDTLIEMVSVNPFWGLPDNVDQLVDKFIDRSRRLTEIRRKWSMRGIVQKYKAEHRGYVYLFKLSTGHYKIGLSNNPQRRGREIVSGLPLTIELIHQIPSNQIACLEDELHRRFKDKQYDSTEWFTLTDEDVKYICGITERDFEWVNNPEWDEFYRVIDERRKKNDEEAMRRIAERRAQQLSEYQNSTAFFNAGPLGQPSSS